MIVLLFIVGFAGNVIGTLAGGGGLLTLPTMLLLGMPIHAAIGANKVSNTLSTFTNILTSFYRKEITWKEVRILLAVCFAGGFVGAVIAHYLTADTLQWVAICLLVFAFCLSFLRSSEFGKHQQLPMKPSLLATLFSIGAYDGVFGPGSGTLVLYSFAQAKLHYYKAVVYGRVCIFATCFGAAIIYVWNGYIIWSHTFALMAGSVVGAYFGMKIAKKVSAHVAKLLLRIITLLLIVQLVIEMI